MSARVSTSGGMSARDSKAFRKDVRSGLADTERKRYSKVIKDLDAELQKTKAEGRERLKKQRKRCGDEYEEVRGKARTEIERIRVERDYKKTSCAVEAEHVKAEARAEEQIRQAKIDAERDHRAQMRKIDANNREREKERPKATSAERRAETDGEVEANFSARETAVYRKVKRGLKVPGRMTRTEAFQQYLHDNGGLVRVEAALGLHGGPSDDELARQQREHEENRRGRAPKPRLPKAPF